MDIDASALIETLKAQRNEALDELALVRAALNQLQAERGQPDAPDETGHS